MSTSEKSLTIIREEGVFKKIINFFKKIFSKKELIEEKAIYQEKVSNNSEKQKEFVQAIKFEEDMEKSKLLKIQDEIEKRGINKENVYELTKDLSDEQKEKLKELYQTQIKEYKVSLENYKRKILNIKKNI